MCLAYIRYRFRFRLFFYSHMLKTPEKPFEYVALENKKNCMKTIHFGLFTLICCLFYGCVSGEKKGKTSQSSETPPFESFPKPILTISPIQHATIVLQWKDITIYVDPVGGVTTFSNHKKPDLILITDIHSDHFSLATLEGLDTGKAKIMVPQVVADELPEPFTPQIDVLDNGDSKERYGITVEAVPMYYLREEALTYHPKGGGNGYLLDMESERIYISGATQGIPEKRALQNITKAFVSMNLHYTMSVESAADAVLAFAPKEVFPYLYRGTEGYSDVLEFSKIVTERNPKIKVTVLNWYKY